MDFTINFLALPSLWTPAYGARAHGLASKISTHRSRQAAPSKSSKRSKSDVVPPPGWKRP